LPYKKKEFRKAGYSDKEIKDSFGFLYVDEEQEVEKLCRNGITVSNLKSSSLGRADMGKYMYMYVYHLKSILSSRTPPSDLHVHL
jgi:hypothetical protein